MNDEQIANYEQLWLSIMGVGKKDNTPKYLEITEGRNDWCPKPECTYHWCGDAVTWTLHRAGVRDGSLLNRAELNGRWVEGDNLARIYRWAKSRGLLKAGKPKQAKCIYSKNAKAGGHIGYVVSINGDQVTTFDGNSKFFKVAQNIRSMASEPWAWWVSLYDIPLDVNIPNPNPSPALPSPWDWLGGWYPTGTDNGTPGEYPPPLPGTDPMVYLDEALGTWLQAALPEE